VRLALPLVRASGMDVVAFGRSDHGEQSFFLIRAYRDRAQLAQQQDGFYGSVVWRKGPQQAWIDCLDSYLNTLLWLPDEAIDALRANHIL
jgi:hypothetical protein